jgi:hypothetical protein
VGQAQGRSREGTGGLPAVTELSGPVGTELLLLACRPLGFAAQQSRSGARG